MIIFLHVLVAVLGIVFTTGAIILPRQQLIRISSVFVGLTFASGTTLVIATRHNIIQTCLTGLIYLAVTVSGIVLASRRLTAKDGSE
jgi:hypothetical protein